MWRNSFATILSPTIQGEGVLKMISVNNNSVFSPKLAAGFLVVFMLALITGWSATGNAAESASLNGWTINSGPIKTSTSTTTPKAKQVSGSIKLKSTESPAGTRRAGACLVADLTTQGVGLPSCTTHQQCNDAYKAMPNANLGSGTPGPYLYCLSERANDSAKRCWIRPGPGTSHCIKGQLAPGKHAVPTAGTVAADPLGNDKPVNWTVYGCLNPDNSVPPACENTDSTAKVNSRGKVKKVKP